MQSQPNIIKNTKNKTAPWWFVKSNANIGKIKDIKKSHEFFFREFEKISEDNKLLKQTLNYITSKTD